MLDERPERQPPELLGTRIVEAHVDVGEVPPSVANRRILVLATEPKHAIEPRGVLTAREGVVIDSLLNAKVNESRIEVGVGDERSQQCPGARQIERVCRGRLVPVLLTRQVEEADVGVASGLVTRVWMQTPAGLARDVADEDRVAPRKLRVNLRHRRFEVRARLLGGPRRGRLHHLEERV